MKQWIALLLAGSLVAGCASTGPNGQQTANRAGTGAVIGAISGAVIGHQVDKDRGAIAGAVIGGATGAVVGNYMDEQERAFNEALAEEQRQNEIEVERVRDDLLKLTLDSEVSFDFDRAEIKPAFRPSLDKLGRVLRRYDRTEVLVVGHTDATGPDEYNQRLSERRAMAVADYLSSNTGVDRFRLRTEGRGEREPRADNSTEAGRQLNRRVEVYVRPEESVGRR